MVSLFIHYPSFIRPEIVSFLPIRWYSLMYLVGLFIAIYLMEKVSKRDHFLSKDTVENFAFSAFFGLVIFAHIFSCLFYSDWRYYLSKPWMMFWPFENGVFVGLPGMSYHGGLFGAVLGSYIYCRIKKIDYLRAVDMACTCIPLGYTFGRLGNFINAELYGRVTLAPWGMIFPHATPFSTSESWVQEFCQQLGVSVESGGWINLPRHPSQLYEAFFEGIVIFFLLYYVVAPYAKKHLKKGSVFSCYLFLYGFFRFCIEYCRQPDADIGYVIALGKTSDNIALFQSFLNISKGQVFCFIMMVLGLLFFGYCNRKEAVV